MKKHCRLRKNKNYFNFLRSHIWPLIKDKPYFNAFVDRLEGKRTVFSCLSLDINHRAVWQTKWFGNPLNVVGAAIDYLRKENKDGNKSSKII